MLKLQVLYGSETGTAQGICEDIYRHVVRNFEGLCCFVSAFDSYDVKSLVSEKLLLCLCSTTGDGDPPRNVRKFWRFVFRRDLPENSLQGVKIAFLGLGDSSYSKFNFAAKKLYRRLTSLGASPFANMELHLADEQDEFGIEQETSKFLNEFWCGLEANGIIKRSVPLIAASYFQCTVRSDDHVDESNKESKDTAVTQKLLASQASSNAILRLRCVRNDRVTSDEHFQETRLLAFEMDDDQTWLPGDTVHIAPVNDNEAVARFLRLTVPSLADLSDEQVLAFGEQQQVTVQLRNSTSTSGGVDRWDALATALRPSVSMKLLVSRAFDLNCVPTQRFFSQLQQQVSASSVATDDAARLATELERLHELGSLRFANDYLDYAQRPKRSTLETLEDFPLSARALRFEQLLELLPAIRARPYSVSTCSRPLQLLVAVVRYRTRLSRPRIGICSDYLRRLSSESIAFGWMENNAWPTEALHRPCVMVGCGTGVAPFRALVDARVARAVDRSVLAFGCRFAEADNYLERCGDLRRWPCALVHVLHAFSRQPPRSYVQQTVVQHAQLLWPLLNDDCVVFVCGGAKLMAEQVRQAFVQVCQLAGALTAEQAELHIASLERRRRYVVEVWD